MAWIAAIISAVGGLAAGAGQKSAASKASKSAALQAAAGYGGAKKGLEPYAKVGRKAAYSLAELMGMEGYRTPEEQAYTQFLKTKPTLPGETPWQSKADSSTLAISGHPMYQEDRKSGQYALSVGLSGLGGIADVAFQGARKDRKDAARAALYEDVAARKKYRQDLKEWNKKKAELEAASTASLANYDPSAALRRTPGYEFRFGEGERAVQANQAARNNTLSGRALKELTQYGQGFASNEFQNEFARRLSLANMGQQAQTATGNWSVGQGATLGNLALGQGQANADFYGTANNALQSGLSNYLTYQARQNQTPAATTPYSSSYGPAYGTDATLLSELPR
jgi:hypothetical protein